jgi:hypothetical protein
VFEIEALPFASGIPGSTSERLVMKLNENYGCIGSLYSDFIVRNKAVIEQIITRVSDDLEATFHFGPRRGSGRIPW